MSYAVMLCPDACRPDSPSAAAITPKLTQFESMVKDVNWILIGQWHDNYHPATGGCLGSDAVVPYLGELGHSSDFPPQLETCVGALKISRSKQRRLRSIATKKYLWQACHQPSVFPTDHDAHASGFDAIQIIKDWKPLPPSQWESVSQVYKLPHQHG